MQRVVRLLLTGLTLSVLGVVLYAGSKDNKAAEDEKDVTASAAVSVPDSYWLGLQVAPVPDILLPHFGIKEEESKGLAVIEQIVPESPAAKAGLKRGDVILRFADKNISTLNDLVKQVAAVQNTEQKMSVIRGGKEMEIAVTPAQRPANAVMMSGAPFSGQPFPQQMIPAPGMRLGREFWVGPRDPQKMMKEMEEHFRQMHGGDQLLILPETDELADDSSNRLEVFSKTNKDGKSSVQVKKFTKSGEKTEEKLWEAESVDKLPEEVRKEVQTMFRGL